MKYNFKKSISIWLYHRSNAKNNLLSKSIYENWGNPKVFCELWNKETKDDGLLPYYKEIIFITTNDPVNLDDIPHLKGTDYSDGILGY